MVVASLPGRIYAELMKDDRVADVSATVIVDEPASGLVTYTIEIDVVPADETEDFTLTLAVTATSAELLGVEA